MLVSLALPLVGCVVISYSVTRFQWTSLDVAKYEKGLHSACGLLCICGLSPVASCTSSLYLIADFCTLRGGTLSWLAHGYIALLFVVSWLSLVQVCL